MQGSPDLLNLLQGHEEVLIIDAIAKEPQMKTECKICVCCRSDQEQEEEEDPEEEGKEHKEPLTPGQIARKAILLLIAGTAVCAFFSDPMVDAVSAFSKVRVPHFICRESVCT
jgi:hypothetical protein